MEHHKQEEWIVEQRADGVNEYTYVPSRLTPGRVLMTSCDQHHQYRCQWRRLDDEGRGRSSEPSLRVTLSLQSTANVTQVSLEIVLANPSNPPQIDPAQLWSFQPPHNPKVISLMIGGQICV